MLYTLIITSYLPLSRILEEVDGNEGLRSQHIQKSRTVRHTKSLITLHSSKSERSFNIQCQTPELSRSTINCTCEGIVGEEHIWSLYNFACAQVYLVKFSWIFFIVAGSWNTLTQEKKMKWLWLLFNVILYSFHWLNFSDLFTSFFSK